MSKHLDLSLCIFLVVVRTSELVITCLALNAVYLFSLSIQHYYRKWLEEFVFTYSLIQNIAYFFLDKEGFSPEIKLPLPLEERTKGRLRFQLQYLYVITM